jgi:hypothetical protein
MAALAARAATAWETGQVREAVEILRDAARHRNGISADFRHPQPLRSLPLSSTFDNSMKLRASSKRWSGIWLWAGSRPGPSSAY